MAETTTSGILALQPPIHIDVSYFDEIEEAKFLNYPTKAKIDEITSRGIDIQAAQFLKYCLFHRIRPGKPGYSNADQIGDKVGRINSELDEWVLPRNGSLVLADALSRRDDITQYIGEAGALSVMERLHDVHDADWTRIPIHGGPRGFPTFDYQYAPPTASDGKYIIQIEAKGTAVKDTAELTNSARAHKHNIVDKKKRIDQIERADGYQYPANLRYGAVCALGQTGALRCWLLDPPAEEGVEARNYRLLTRLQFMSDWISFLSGRSQFAASLATRLRALHALSDPFELDEVPLVRGSGEPFEIPAFDRFGRPPSLFARLCRVADGPAVGTIFRLYGGQLFFAGVQRHIFEMAAQQDFNKILSYRDLGGSSSKRLNCIVSRGRARNMDLEGLDDGSAEDSAYIQFSTKGLLHYSQGGAVFGIVNPEKR